MPRRRPNSWTQQKGRGFREKSSSADWLGLNVVDLEGIDWVWIKEEES